MSTTSVGPKNSGLDISSDKDTSNCVGPGNSLPKESKSPSNTGTTKSSMPMTTRIAMKKTAIG